MSCRKSDRQLAAPPDLLSGRPAKIRPNWQYRPQAIQKSGWHCHSASQRRFECQKSQRTYSKFAINSGSVLRGPTLAFSCFTFYAAPNLLCSWCEPNSGTATGAQIQGKNICAGNRLCAGDKVIWIGVIIGSRAICIDFGAAIAVAKKIQRHF